MEFEQDYVMRLIKDMVRFLMQLITGNPQFERRVIEDKGFRTCEDDYARLIALADAGNINEAENLLYQNLVPDDRDYLLMGLTFYSHLNDYDDDFLERCGYSREEIKDGIENFVKEYGVTGLQEFYSSSFRMM